MKENKLFKWFLIDVEFKLLHHNNIDKHLSALRIFTPKFVMQLKDFGVKISEILEK